MILRTLQLAGTKKSMAVVNFTLLQLQLSRSQRGFTIVVDEDIYYDVVLAS